ncbi:potassium channel family protein [Kocuria oceani]|uniref:potassium channel family protein n=1 Tax=Kocuria oceani TaxID=988827 RepID=UPI0040370880
MFHTLLHPSGQGLLSRWVLSAVWKVSKAAGHQAGSAVGPAAMVTVIVCWVMLQGVGWALIYVPHVPDGFVYSSGVNPMTYPDFAEALYVSFVTLATLGFGDVVPTDPWIRMAAPFEALTGFALLTAALTWFTQVYPPLSRRRALALHLKRLADSGYAETMHGLEASSASRVLEALAAEVAAVRVDFTQHTEGFYFQEQDPDLSLGRQLPHALRLRDAARDSTDLTVQLGAQQLSLALEQLAAKLKNSFVHTGEDPGEVFAAYAAEHGQASRP